MVLGFGYDSDGVGVLIWRVGFNGRRSRWSVFGLETGPLRFWHNAPSRLDFRSLTEALYVVLLSSDSADTNF